MVTKSPKLNSSTSLHAGANKLTPVDVFKLFEDQYYLGTGFEQLTKSQLEAVIPALFRTLSHITTKKKQLHRHSTKK